MLWRHALVQRLRIPRYSNQSLLISAGIRFFGPVTDSSARLPWRYTRAKSTKTILVKELPQGFLAQDQQPLPEIQSDDAPQYPVVVQGAKNNMLKYKDCVLLTRVGKFYELYFEQAEEYAPLLDIKLASKRAGSSRVAMAGFPYTQLDKYLKILVQELNKNVAISEEYAIPASRKSSSGGLMFDRIVKRVVTPGTLIDESFLDPNQNNYLLAVHVREPEQDVDSNEEQEITSSNPDSPVGMAWMDLSTGEFFIGSTTLGSLPTSLARINAREIIMDPDMNSVPSDLVSSTLGHTVTYIKPDYSEFSISSWAHMFEDEVSEKEFPLMPAEGSAINLLLSYAESKIDTDSLKLQHPVRPDLRDIMAIDRSSLRGLEILETSRDGFHQGSLLHAIRRTVTKGGARLLRSRLTSPSASLLEIEGRLNLVSTFLAQDALREELINLLRQTYDTLRLVQKITLNRNEPDDLLSLARAIKASESIYNTLQKSLKEKPNLGSAEMTSLQYLVERINLDGPVLLGRKILDAIDEDRLDQIHRQEEEAELSAIEVAKRVIVSEGSTEDMELLGSKSKRAKPTSSKEESTPYMDAWIMRRSASTGLRKLHNGLDELKDQKEELSEKLRQKLKSPSLTLKWSPSLGYFAHMKAANKSSLDHIQARVVSSSKSTKSVVLEEWSRLGSEMDQIRTHIRDEELVVLQRLRQGVRTNLVKLRRNASVMDEIDVACSFASLAKEHHLVRPIMADGTIHKIYGGRHPTVELGLAKSGRQFVRNDCMLDSEKNLWLVTGPNMAGKSTFLRQNALIIILAQVGSYVPADYAELGIVDKIFSRVGAADDLFRDQSTFMVEMLETAEILKDATPRSFVIMDEVGRGTSPLDGTAIAYACLHHLHNVNKCRTLFATHFHDLAEMTQTFEHLACYCTRVEAEDGSFSFVHRLEKGVNRQSHALDVARLAGLPPQALSIAAETLKQIQGQKKYHELEVESDHSLVAQVAAQS